MALLSEEAKRKKILMKLKKAMVITEETEIYSLLEYARRRFRIFKKKIAKKKNQ